MNKRSCLLHTCATIFALTLLLNGSSLVQTPASAATPASPATGSSKDVCLACHGSFDKLVSKTANYNGWLGREKASPHRYVPHKTKDIPNCSHCHKPHPVPLTSMEGLPKPNADWCYTCHHTGFLECGACHPVP
jgi:hypothetical protein